MLPLTTSKQIGGADFFDPSQDKALMHAHNKVHMYQEDIGGKNAIDNAFECNAIFCIKAFVDNLLQLTDEMQFRNCFDKALITMVKKGMDVKELVDSKLFYSPIWEDQMFFCEVIDLVAKPYNNDIEDLQFENPN